MDAKLTEMSAEDLWILHEEMSAVLSRKIRVRKARLEELERNIGLNFANVKQPSVTASAKNRS